MRFADDVLLFATSLEQLQKMMCEFKQSTEKVGLQIYPRKTNTLCNQSSNKRSEVPIDNIKVETLSKGWKYKISWTNGCIPATEDNRDQELNLGCLGVVLQIQARVDLKILLSSALASLIRHGDHPNDEPRIRNKNTLERTPENGTIDSAQHAPPHRTNKTKIQKEDTENEEKVEEGVWKPEKEKDEEEEKENHGNSEDETADGNSSNTDCDQDSDISSWKIQMKKLTQLTLKKKNGLTTWREAEMKSWNGWKQEKSLMDRNTKEWYGDWLCE